MKKLRDDDYLIEIMIRVAVRKQDVAALLSQADIRPSDDFEPLEEDLAPWENHPTQKQPSVSSQRETQSGGEVDRA